MNAVTQMPLPTSPPKQSDTTRFMCGSVFLGHDREIREKLRTHVLDRFHSVAENPGLNVRLLARVLDFYHQKKLRYMAWHGPLGVLYFLILGIWLIAASPDTQPLIVALLIVGATALAIPTYRRYMRNRYDYALQNFTRDNFDSKRAMEKFANSSGKLEKKVATEDASANVSVFGGFEPFIGWGGSLGDWSLLIDTRKGKDDHPTVKFSVQDIERAIGASFQQLSLPDLEVGERLFVHGVDVSIVDGLLPDRFARPQQRVAEEILARLRISESRTARVYQFAKVAAWTDQVYVSFFYRVTFRGPMLYIENHARVLQPVSTDHRAIDNLTAPKTRARVGQFFGCTLAAPFACIGECFQLLALIRSRGEIRKSEAEQKEKIEEQARYNYGTTTSLRESFSASIYNHFFEKSDRDLYVKILQKQLLDSVIEFLDSRNVDTSELRDQRSYIINSGLIVHGDLQADAVAVGKAAKANTRGLKRTRANQAAAAGGGAT